jgi:hypothetical protein
LKVLKQNRNREKGKETVYGNDVVVALGITLGGFVSRVASQPELGILPEWWGGSSSGDRSGFDAHWSHLGA